MSQRSHARLTLSDLMILIGAIGFGIGGYVFIDNSLFKGQRYMFGAFQPPPGGWTSITVIDRAAGIAASLLVLFGGLTFAVPIIVWRRPRPIRRRSIRGAGTTACLAALTGMLIASGVAGLSFAMRRAFDGSVTLPANFWNRGILFDDVILFAGVGVASAWTIQMLDGRWQLRPELIDRVGRLVGGLWLLAALVFATRQLLI